MTGIEALCAEDPYCRAAAADYFPDPSIKLDAFRVKLEELVCLEINFYDWRTGKRSHVGPPRQVEVTPEFLARKGKQRPYVKARQWCFLFLRHHPFTRLSSPVVGRIYGRDHSTVLTGVKVALGAFAHPSRTTEAACIRKIAALLEPEYGPFTWPGGSTLEKSA